jgi:hypothetical protein
VHGGWLKFSVVLSGSALRDKFINAGLKPDPARPQEINLPFSMEISGMTHNLNVPVKTVSQ